jgi:probable F420-dependent oxidoreductase
MNHGLYVPNCGAFGDPHNVIRLAVAAEENGWDGLFLWDHLKTPLPGGADDSGIEHHVIDPWVALTAAATATKRIRLGTAVTPVPRRRPHKLARETASLDRLSGGRVVLGVGTGEGAAELDQFGEEEDHRTRGDMLDEALDIITRLWSGTSVDHVGPHYRAEEARFLPTPIQQPRIPIWVGGVWPNRRPMRRAARWDGVIPLFQVWSGQDFDLLRDCMEYIRQHRAGDESFDIVYPGISPGDRPDEAASQVAAYRDAGVTWWLESIAPYRFDPDIDDPWNFERLRERVLQGPPAAG